MFLWLVGPSVWLVFVLFVGCGVVLVCGLDGSGGVVFVFVCSGLGVLRVSVVLVLCAGSLVLFLFV